MNFKNIHVLSGLEMPDASLIKTIEHKVSSFTADHGWFKTSKKDTSNMNTLSSLGKIDSSTIPSALSTLSLSSAAKTDRSPLFEALWICH